MSKKIVGTTKKNTFCVTALCNLQQVLGKKLIQFVYLVFRPQP